MTTKKINRREFLKWQMAAAAVGTGSLFPLVGNMANVQAASVGGGYKALVCVFLYGGNDSFNMVIPQSNSAYNAYAQARQSLAVPKSDLLPITPDSYNDGAGYGFHPKMAEVKQLFDNKKLSIIANVGMLAEPITQAQYESGIKAKPPQLFSHSDQQDLWMKAKADSQYPFGWAGRMTDLLYPNAALAPKPAVNLSTREASLWQTGLKHSMYEVPYWGVDPLYFPWHDGDYKMEKAYQDIYALGANSSHTMVSHYAGLQERADDLSGLISNALESAPMFSNAFDQESEVSKQLEMVAKLIAVRNDLDSSTTRQVFFVGFGGWDTHDNQNEKHPQLLQKLSQSLNSFNLALEQLGLEDQVTTFTASEFGRSLTPNNNGTDHGWGGHNLVMGGSVKGGDIFGTMPKIQVNSPDAVSDDRIIPTTSVEQYSATLASWFGLNSQEINTVFPNLHRFNAENLGFLV